MTHSVHTTYFGGLGGVAVPDDDDLVIGVVRHPRDFVYRVVDRNVPALGPTDDLINPFKTVEEAANRDGLDNPKQIAWENCDFEARYRSFLGKPTQRRLVGRLREEVHTLDVWLVGWSRDVRYSHRCILADVLVDGTDATIVHHPSIEQIEEEETATEIETAQISDYQQLTTDGGLFQ